MTVITSDISDDVWKFNPDAVYVCGVFGEPHMDQFSGCGPSATPYKFKALLVNGIVYIPDPETRRTDNPQTRRWIAASTQPPSYAVRPVTK